MNRINHIILRHIRQEKLSMADATSLQNWLLRSENNQLLLEELQLQWDTEHLSKEDFQGQWSKVESTLDAERLDNVKVKVFSNNAVTVYRWWAIAATLTLLIGATLWVMLAGNTLRTVETGYGEKMSLLLPDGSRVKLNANSSLSYEKKWNDKDSRAVQLAGEAFFEVMKKPKTGQKFTVITEDLSIEVLGTVFNVNSYHNKTSVFLEEGSVKLSLFGINDKMTMVPGELVTYSEQIPELPVKQKADPELHTSWKDDVLIFDNDPLSEVFEKLASYYGINIIANEENMKNETITTGIPMQDLNIAIKILERVTNYEYTLEGTTLKVESKDLEMEN